MTASSTPLDPAAIAAMVKATHDYDYSPAAAARAASTLAITIAALERVAPGVSHFTAEPADLATTLAALAPKGE